MAINPEIRFLIVYLLVLRWAVALYYRRSRQWLANELAPDDPFIRRVWTIVWWLALAALAVYVLGADAWDPLASVVPIAVRWLALVPAVAAILLTIWSLDLASGPDEFFGDENPLWNMYRRRPYRLIRHPRELADGVLLMSLAVLSGQPWILVLTGIAVLFVFTTIVPLQDGRLARKLGVGFVDYSLRSGRLLPRWSWRLTPRAAQYQVPHRFGLTAILALLTVLSVVFGGMNMLRYYVEIPPAVYLFVASQILAVCLAQMIFGTAPRLVSTLSGAILLPTFVLVTVTFPGAVPVGVRVGIVLSSVFAGSILGYFAGTIAAGFFLVTDWLEGLFKGKTQRP